MPTSRRIATAAVAGSLLLAVPTLAMPTAAAAASTPTFTRISGPNRFATAAMIAETTYTTTDTVVLANGLTPADALAGGYLAGRLGAPVLLTMAATTPAETLAAIQQLGAKNVTLLGGTTAISAAQQQALSQTASSNSAGGNLSVTRLAGSNRFQTSEQIILQPGASAVGTIGGVPTALIANGVKFPDALAGAAVAAGAALPMLLTDGQTLTTDEGEALQSLGIKQAYILGGPGAVAPAVESAVNGLGITTHRLAGANRTATADAIAQFAAQTLQWSPTSDCSTDSSGTTLCDLPTIDVARGDDPGGGVDALALGPLAGKTKTPILLTAGPDDPSSDLYGEELTSSADGVLTSVTIAGGTVAVTAANQAFQQTAAGLTPTPTFSVSPTTVMTGGTITIDDSANPCPAAPAGAHAFGLVIITPTDSTSTVQPVFFQRALPLSGGQVSGAITLPASITAGSYAVFIACAADFSPVDPTKYVYEFTTPVTLTVQ